MSESSSFSASSVLLVDSRVVTANWLADVKAAKVYQRLLRKAFERLSEGKVIRELAVSYEVK